MSDTTQAPTISPEALKSADSDHTKGVEEGSSKNVTTFTTIGSVSELREKAPQLYHQMTIGIAMTICHEMRQHADHLKEIMREGRAAVS